MMECRRLVLTELRMRLAAVRGIRYHKSIVFLSQSDDTEIPDEVRVSSDHEIEID